MAGNNIGFNALALGDSILNKKKKKVDPSFMSTDTPAFTPNPGLNLTNNLRQSPVQLNSGLDMQPSIEARLALGQQGLDEPTIGRQARDGLFGAWAHPIGGKNRIPLDLGVTLAGMMANAIAPNEFGGRLGKQIAEFGGNIYGKRLEQQITAPERDLDARFKQAQINKINKPDLIKGDTGTMIEETSGAKFFTEPKLIKGKSGIMIPEEPGAQFYTPPDLMKGKDGTMVPKEVGTEFYTAPNLATTLTRA